MEQALILACDIGTSGVKTSLVRPDGTVFASESSSYPTYSPQTGWSEQNPLDWWEGFCRNTRSIFRRFPDSADLVAAIGVSGHMLGCLPLDAQGEPLYHSMIHSDTRAASQCDGISDGIGKEKVYSITGNILDSRSTVCKILWLKENRPDIYRKTERFVQSKDFIVARLTGNLDVTDYSDASHAQLLNISTQAYDDYLSEVGVDRTKLPTILKGTDVAGKLTMEAARELGLKSGIPVAVGGGDGACANIGAGVVKPGDTYICIGTTAWSACISPLPVFDRSRRLFNILSADGMHCGVYGTVQSAGKAIQWVMNLFEENDVRRFDMSIDNAIPGCDGLIFLPYLEGERSPIFDPLARGVFFGISPLHRKEHFMRATMEGVTMALRHVVDVFRETMEIKGIRVIGGGARSETWRRILSQICAAEILSLNVAAEEGTSLGAAVVAGVAAGIFTSIEDGVKSICVRERIYPDENEIKQYETVYNTYTSLYPALKPIFAKNR